MLNAFRHHCGQHQECGPHEADLGEVLNAFRHHCGQHRRAAVELLESQPCSTPFGITAVNTPRPPRRATGPGGAQRLSASLRSTHYLTQLRHKPALGAQRLSASLRSTHREGGVPIHPSAVLNAFRHHCGQHKGITTSSFPFTRMCSTPFGITAVNTFLSPSSQARLICAQRLSASLRSTRPCRPGTFAAGPVLNAFRHHCGQHADSLAPSGKRLTSAQRLSASLRSTQSLMMKPTSRTVSAQRLSASLRSTRHLPRGP